jgi:hypothetical protein
MDSKDSRYISRTDFGRRGVIRGSLDLNLGGLVRSRGDMVIFVCVLKRKTPGGDLGKY